MPPCHVYPAAEAGFAFPKPQSLSEIVQRLGYNSDRCGALCRLVRAFLIAESRCAAQCQVKRVLSGELEADGATLKKWWPIGSTANFYQQVFGVVDRHARTFFFGEIQRCFYFVYLHVDKSKRSLHWCVGLLQRHVSMLPQEDNFTDFTWLRHCAAANFGKPPTESLCKLEACGASQYTEPNSVVMSDGCKAYATWV